MNQTAYALLGVAFLILLGGGYFLAERAYAPENVDVDLIVNETDMLTLFSPAFVHEGLVPQSYTCDGKNIHPPLSISGVPAEAKSLVLLMDDPDIPQFVKESMGIEKFDHWALFNISPSLTKVEVYTVPEGAMQGANSRGEAGYTGPCPPDGEHRYFFTLYALDAMLDLPEGATHGEIQEGMEGHILEETVLMGRYQRKGN